MVNGKTCFDTRGNCYIYVSRSLDGRHHIVRPIYEKGFANCPIENEIKFNDEMFFEDKEI